MSGPLDLENTYADFIKNPDEELSLEHRMEKKQTLQDLLQEETLHEFGKGELRELVRNLWAYHGWTKKDYIVNEMLDDGIENVIETFQSALFDADDPGEQFEILDNNIRPCLDARNPAAQLLTN